MASIGSNTSGGSHAPSIPTLSSPSLTITVDHALLDAIRGGQPFSISGGRLTAGGPLIVTVTPASHGGSK